MGCCLSTPKALKRDPDQQNAPNHHHSPPKSNNKSHVNSNPPPSLEEETVKEVLSETPISKPQDKNTQTIPTSTIQEEKLEKMEDFINKQEEISEISQASDIYSLSESFSTTTTTTIGEDEAMSKQSREVSHRVNRGPSKVPRKRPYIGDLAGGGGGRERVPKSPAGRGGRELSGQVRSTQRNVGSTGVRRDIGEGSRRRSRSPATLTAGGVGRGSRGGSQLKVTGTAGGRLVGGGDVKGGSKKEEEVNEGVLQQGNESLENPLVSLECFIFL